MGAAALVRDNERFVLMCKRLEMRISMPALLLAVARRAWPQAPTNTVRVLVRDQTGAVIPNARLRARLGTDFCNAPNHPGNQNANAEQAARHNQLTLRRSW
jgi:hypothetical protein